MRNIWQRTEFKLLGTFFMDDFIRALYKEKRETPELSALRAFAEHNHVPIIREDAEALLRLLVRLKQPKSILETGTAIGYSAIAMARAASVPPQIDTVEIDLDTAAAARKNIRQMGLQNEIRVIAGDAAEVLPCLTKQYDMIFIDSAKGQYLQLYDVIKARLHENGLLICDNVIFYGKIFDTPEEAPHKHRTIVSNMRSFLQRLFADPDYTSVILDTGDGMTVSIKKEF